MIDADGNILAGRHAVEPTAMYIHSAVYRICKTACVLHTHIPYVSAFSLTQARRSDIMLSQNAMRFHGRVRADDHFNGRALDPSEGERLANLMKGADVSFLGNHGVIVCGHRIDHGTRCACAGATGV